MRKRINVLAIIRMRIYRCLIPEGVSTMVIEVRKMGLKELVALCNSTARSPEARYAAQSELLARKLRVAA